MFGSPKIADSNPLHQSDNSIRKPACAMDNASWTTCCATLPQYGKTCGKVLNHVAFWVLLILHSILLLSSVIIIIVVIYCVSVFLVLKWMQVRTSLQLLTLREETDKVMLPTLSSNKLFSVFSFLVNCRISVIIYTSKPNLRLRKNI